MESKSLARKYIGTKAFYLRVMAILIPMIIQQGITNFVNLLDNIMVGQLGTEQMSGVSIVNQIIFVFNLTIFGGVSGASIFGAQFFGKRDNEGLKNSFRFKIILSSIVCVIGISIMAIWGESLFSLYLNDIEGDSGDITATLGYAKEYMRIIIFGLVPFAVTQCFSSSQKEMGETFAAMVSSIISIVVNLVFNYLLIFGKFGFPQLGVAGAAIATVIARYTEAIFMVTNTIKRRKLFTYINGAFKTLKIPAKLTKTMIKTTAPLLLNEMLYALGAATILQCYSIRGLSVVAAVNINSTIHNVFSIVVFASGSAVGILVGQRLGANDIEGARDTVRKLLVFTVSLNTIFGIILIFVSHLFPLLYNTSEEIRQIAASLLIISGSFIPFEAFTHSCYFITRSGGRTFVTFLFDCLFSWVVMIPIAYVLINFTSMSFTHIFLLVNASCLIKVIIGAVMIKTGIWIKNVVA